MTIDHVLEALLRRDRWLVATMLSAIAIASWGYVLTGAGIGTSAFEMTRMRGDGMGMTMPAAWSLAYALLVLGMWWVMMIAMMLPAATPMLFLFAAIQRRRRRDGNPFVSTGLFLLSYLVMWGGFSVAAVALQWSLASSGLFRSDMALAGAAPGGGLLLAAGLYQLTPLKQACLRQCQNPARFIALHWRNGVAGALRMGFLHGAYCLGCCWFLMLLLFFGGVMNLCWIGGLALFVLFEKAVPPGHWLSNTTGLVLLGAGSWLLTKALL